MSNILPGKLYSITLLITINMYTIVQSKVTDSFVTIWRDNTVIIYVEFVGENYIHFLLYGRSFYLSKNLLCFITAREL